MKKIETLGIFDSGLGGYTVYQDLKEQLPDLSMVLLADQKNAPYGNYGHDKITSLAIDAMNWFLNQGITDVLLACNTVTSVAQDTLNEMFPQMRIWGIIDLTLNQLPKDVEDVAVVATSATVSTLAYTEGFNQHFNGKIEERAMKDLAIAIESLEDETVIDKMIEETMETLDHPSHVILGCTHYPLVKAQFEKVSNAVFVDSILPIRNFIQENYKKTNGVKRVVTTKDADMFKRQIKTIYQKDEEVTEVCVK